MKIKRGFTLAEVLIVISVIAIFAVATIPAMIKSTTEKQFIQI